MAERLLTVDHLSVHYREHRRRGQQPPAVDDVTFHLNRGETLGLVGESGSGKSSIGNTIVGLVMPTAGQILLRDRDITHAGPRERRQLSRHLQIIFQNPYGSLNPSRTIGQTLAEPLRALRSFGRRDATQRVAAALAHVGMSPDAIHRYPAAFSGGQRQRVAIARALVVEPELIVCDEPTSALDLSIQAQILNLLRDLQQHLGLSYLFISHDIDVIRHMSERAAVLYRGRIVEHGPARMITESPTHDYTRTLIAAVPVPDPRARL